MRVTLGIAVRFSGWLSVSVIFWSATWSTIPITGSTIDRLCCCIECGQFRALSLVVHNTGSFLTENWTSTGWVITREEALSIAGVVGVRTTEKMPIVVAHFLTGFTGSDTSARLHNVRVRGVGVSGAHIRTGWVRPHALVLEVIDLNATGTVVQAWVCSSVFRWQFALCCLVVVERRTTRKLPFL